MAISFRDTILSFRSKGRTLEGFEDIHALNNMLAADTEEQQYTVTWTVNRSYGIWRVGDLRYQFTGTKAEVRVLLGHLNAKGKIYTSLDIQPVIKNHDAREGHWHTINGVPQFHKWDDCPERT